MTRQFWVSRVVTAGAGLLIALVSASAPATANDFRIETRIFVGDQTEPSSENLTLFRGGQVYDFMPQADRATIYDKARGRVILLNTKDRTKCEMKSEQLFDFTEDLKTLLGKQTDVLLKFGAEPRFEQSIDEATGATVFVSPFMTYKVEGTKPEGGETLKHYFDFADTSVRLNAMTNPGALPPFARLSINESLLKKGVIPTKVSVMLPPRQRFGGKTVSLRSDHRIQWRLIESDQWKIEEAGEYSVTFTATKVNEFVPHADQHAHR